MVALTFDDGPSLRDTGRLLDLLAEEDVTVTFLVLGTQVASGREELLKRAFDEGHEIGNCASHAIFTGLKADEIRNELKRQMILLNRSPAADRPSCVRRPVLIMTMWYPSVPTWAGRYQLELAELPGGLESS